jgi:hypothetical protein
MVYLSELFKIVIDVPGADHDRELAPSIVQWAYPAVLA